MIRNTHYSGLWYIAYTKMGVEARSLKQISYCFETYCALLMISVI